MNVCCLLIDSRYRTNFNIDEHKYYKMVSAPELKKVSTNAGGSKFILTTVLGSKNIGAFERISKRSGNFTRI